MPPPATPADSTTEAVRSLKQLADEVGGRIEGGDASITGIAQDSRHVRPGDLFVALRGTREDGAAYVRDAAARGAAAACVAGDDVDGARGAGIPLIAVSDPHAALARLASAFYDHPSRSLDLVGVTGTLGKTSTALLIATALTASGSGRSVGVVGSLGTLVRGPAAKRVPQHLLPHLGGMTTPDAPTLHQALRVLADAAVDTAVMEVTSHALSQRRVEGLVFALGVLTNLVPDEHLEYHPSPEHYLRTKARFFQHLSPGAPVVFNADDPRVREMVRAATADVARPVVGVSLRATAAATSAEDVVATVGVEALRTDAGGSSFSLRLRRPIPRLAVVGGGTVPPCVVPIVLPVLGVQHVANAALAAAAALVAGATPEGVTEALAEMEPMRRRMEVVRAAAPLVVDDTAGNPETLRAVFATVSELPRATLRVAFGIRGTRGPEINKRLAVTLGALLAECAETGAVQLVVTASADVADERNRVQPAEREAVLDALAAAGVPHAFEPRLADAARRVVGAAGRGDLVLLLGAQGMDRAAEMVRHALGERVGAA